MDLYISKSIHDIQNWEKGTPWVVVSTTVVVLIEVFNWLTVSMACKPSPTTLQRTSQASSRSNLNSYDAEVSQ